MRAIILLSLASLVVGAPGHGDLLLDFDYSDDFPSDFIETNDVEDKAVVEVDTIYENCDEYTKGYGYECVPFYQCHNGTIITDGAGLLDPRMVKIENGYASLAPELSKCPGATEVCCKDPDFTIKTNEHIKKGLDPVPPPPYTPQCGRRNINGLGANIHGFTESESQFGEWPHMCAILQSSDGQPEIDPSYKCGGSLIAPGVVLTAAHCVDDFIESPEELTVRCGEWDTQTETEILPHQDRQVEALEIHPKFAARNLRNDFAILFTTKEFDLSKHIDTACLPEPGETFDGTTCFATGWGKDKFGDDGEYQVILKEIDLPVVNDDDCQDSLRKTKLGRKFKLDSSFVCAGGVNGKDTCTGDGGSPLVCPSYQDPDTYIQAGIVAFGVGCGDDGIPGVYSDVSQASCWIDSVISCYQGTGEEGVPSYFGYTSDVCQVWLETKVFDLENKKNGAGKFGKIFQAMIDKYTKCQVQWQEPNAPIIDPAPPRSNTDGVDDSYNTNEEIVEGDSYNTNEKIIKDDSYKTNEELTESELFDLREKERREKEKEEKAANSVPY